MLQGSQNYIWWTKDHLGKGATASVYKCRNKKTGAQFAVKTFNQASFQRPDSVQFREFDVLRKLKHDNIVRLFDTEEEQTTKSRVIIMEYCNGGSLYNILDKPKNAYGLGEEDFMAFLWDVTAGMHYLSEQRIVHRDIKPGNIMCLVRPDNRPIFKLIDFGAARELDGESFVSMYGTEEYLHPDLYERAVMKRGPFGRSFNSSVDLWSLAATIYHSATGQLPFRPRGGRRNRESMFKILSDLKPGHISGVEMDQGRIEYRTTLPDSCQISLGLRLLITPLLSNLFDIRKGEWPFADFHNRVKDICERRCVHVVALDKAMILSVYMRLPSGNTYGALTSGEASALLKGEIEKQTKILPRDQLLLYENALMNEADARDAITSSTVSSPIFCFTAVENNTPTPELKANMPGLPRIAPALNVEQDYSLAKQLAGKAYCYYRQVKVAHQLQRLYGRAVRVHEAHLIKGVKGGMAELEKVLAGVEETTTRHGLFKEHCRANTSLLQGFGTAAYPASITGKGQSVADAALKVLQKLQKIQGDLDKLVSELGQHMPDLERYAREYNDKLVVRKELSAKWRIDKQCKDEPRCEAQSKALTKALSETAQAFKKDRQVRTLGYNDEQIHKFEKNRMNENSQRSYTLAYEHCFANLRAMHKQFVAWFAMSFKVQQKFQRLEKKVQAQKNLQQNFSRKLSEQQHVFNKLVGEVGNKLHRSASTSANSHMLQWQHLEQMHDELGPRGALYPDTAHGNRAALARDIRSPPGSFPSSGDFSILFQSLNGKVANMETVMSEMKQQVKGNFTELQEIIEFIDGGG